MWNSCKIPGNFTHPPFIRTVKRKPIPPAAFIPVTQAVTPLSIDQEWKRKEKRTVKRNQTVCNWKRSAKNGIHRHLIDDWNWNPIEGIFQFRFDSMRKIKKMMNRNIIPLTLYPAEPHQRPPKSFVAHGKKRRKKEKGPTTKTFFFLLFSSFVCVASRPQQQLIRLDKRLIRARKGPRPSLSLRCHFVVSLLTRGGSCQLGGVLLWLHVTKKCCK